MSNKRSILQTNIPNNETDDDNTITRIRQRWKIDNRLCERVNYIPHRTPRNANRLDWHNAYLPQLMDIHNIVINTMNERYPNNNIRWKTNDQIFHNLSRLLYHCSSKYISKYIDRQWNKIESKDLETESKDGKESETTVDKREEDLLQNKGQWTTTRNRRR